MLLLLLLLLLLLPSSASLGAAEIGVVVWVGAPGDESAAARGRDAGPPWKRRAGLDAADWTCSSTMRSSSSLTGAT